MYCGKHPTCRPRDCILDLLGKGSLDPAPVPACTFCHDHGYVPTAELDADPCPRSMAAMDKAMASDAAAEAHALAGVSCH